MWPRATRCVLARRAKRDHLRLLAALLGFVLVSEGCPVRASQPTPAIPAPCPAPAADVAGWELVDHRAFAFRLPPAFRHVPVQGIDSYVGRYEADGGNTAVSFDFGWYSNDLRFNAGTYSQYDRCTEVIGGRTATIITGVIQNPASQHQHGRQVAAATWRNIRDQPDTVPGHDHLTLWAETRDPQRLPQLLAILRTVEFRRQ